MKITLSGGNYGGQEIEVTDPSAIIEITDDAGVVWRYSPALNSNTSTAEFIGCK